MIAKKLEPKILIFNQMADTSPFKISQKRDIMWNFWRDTICCCEWTRPLIGPRYRGQVLIAGIEGFYQGQVLGAANQGLSSFKVTDYVPPEILHDIPLFMICSFSLKLILGLKTMKKKFGSPNNFGSEKTIGKHCLCSKIRFLVCSIYCRFWWDSSCDMRHSDPY